MVVRLVGVGVKAGDAGRIGFRENVSWRAVGPSRVEGIARSSDLNVGAGDNLAWEECYAEHRICYLTKAHRED